MTPWSSSTSLALRRAARIRLPTKPGQTRTRLAIFPIFFDTVIVVWMTGMDVLSARTTSTRRITLAGEKKCMPMTDSGRLVAVAISSMSRALVFVARMAPGLQI